jgi:hypothetical protein
VGQSLPFCGATILWYCVQYSVIGAMIMDICKIICFMVTWKVASY